MKGSAEVKTCVLLRLLATVLVGTGICSTIQAQAMADVLKKPKVVSEDEDFFAELEGLDLPDLEQEVEAAPKVSTPETKTRSTRRAAMANRTKKEPEPVVKPVPKESVVEDFSAFEQMEDTGEEFDFAQDIDVASKAEPIAVAAEQVDKPISIDAEQEMDADLEDIAVDEKTEPAPVAEELFTADVAVEGPAVQEITAEEMPLEEVAAMDVAEVEAPAAAEEVPVEDEVAVEEDLLAEEAVPAEEVEVDEEEISEEVEEEVLPEEKIGIDTLGEDEPKGNWLFKRIWWEKSEKKYDKLRGVIETIENMRVELISSRNELDRKVLDEFYVSVGLGQGELLEILSELILTLPIERLERKGTLTNQELNLLKKAREDREKLTKLQRDVQEVAKLDERLDEATDQLHMIAIRAHEYERQAWEYFKESARVINDKKARELYYQIEVASHNAGDLLKHLQGAFSTSFKQLMSYTDGQVNQIKNRIQELKERYGTEFKNKVQRLELKQMQQQAQQECQEKIDQAITQTLEEIAGEPQGIVSVITDTVTSFGSTIWSAVRWPFDRIAGLFGGDQEADEDTLDASDIEDVSEMKEDEETTNQE